MEFRILGGLEVRDDSGQACAFVRRKQRLLLAVLLLQANQAVSTERITDWLWGDQPPSSAAQNLHSYVSGLRRQLDNESDSSRIETRAGRYLLRVRPSELDAAVFEDLVGQGRKAASEGKHSTAIERFTRALGLWRTSTVLEDLALPESLRAETARLEQLREDVLEAAYDARLELGQHRELVPELEAATRKHPLRERLWAQRMLALYRSERQADALAVYRTASRTLATELGIDPGPELRRLHSQILNAEQDLDHPADAGSQTGPPAQLPADLSSFTGRDDELSRLLTIPSQRSAVVISAIDGMAGVGKTTLAVHAAHRLMDRYPDGQLFIDLHGFTEGVQPIDPSEALDRLLRSVGVPGGQVPHSLDERSALWRTQLAHRRLLVVLDNAATEAQVTPLLPGTSDSLVLVTSRQRLGGLDDAQPLALDVLSLSDAVALFTRTVGADRVADQSYDQIAEVVRLCGRLPLAIRIAAARLRDRPTWGLADLADRVRDQQRLAELTSGNRSVTAMLRLSYAHLPDTHQRMFRLIGLHPGPDLDAYAAAALADLDLRRASGYLDDLLDTHLLEQHQLGRYRFHDLVRAYAAQTCAETDAEPIRRAASTRLFDHLTHTASIAVDQTYPPEFDHEPRTPPPGTPMPVLDDPDRAAAWLDTELANLLAIPEIGLPEHTLHLSATLHLHLRTRSRHGEAKTLHNKALRVARELSDTRGEYLALVGLGHAQCGLGKPEQGMRWFRAGLEVSRTTDYRVGERHALNAIANNYLILGQWRPASDCFEQALALAREYGDRVGEVGVLLGIGNLHRMRGNTAQAKQTFETALEMASDPPDRNAQLMALGGLARLHRMRGDNQLAAEYYQQTLTLARQLNDAERELGSLAGLANLHRLRGRHDEAIAGFEQALVFARRAGNRNGELEVTHDLGYTRTAAGDPDQALEHHRRVLELATELSQPTDTARAHHGLATAYDALGDYASARTHLCESHRVLSELEITRNEEVVLVDVEARIAELDRLLADQIPT